MERLQSRKLLDRSTFGCLHPELCANGSFYAGMIRALKFLLWKSNAIHSRRISFEKLENCWMWAIFIGQSHAWNACRELTHWCNDACCPKSSRGLTVRVSEAILSVELNSTLCCINAAFLSYDICLIITITKSVY